MYSTKYFVQTPRALCLVVSEHLFPTEMADIQIIKSRMKASFEYSVNFSCIGIWAESIMIHQSKKKCTEPQRRSRSFNVVGSFISKGQNLSHRTFILCHPCITARLSSESIETPEKRFVRIPLRRWQSTYTTATECFAKAYYSQSAAILARTNA